LSAEGSKDVQIHLLVAGNGRQILETRITAEKLALTPKIKIPGVDKVVFSGTFKHTEPVRVSEGKVSLDGPWSLNLTVAENDIKGIVKLDLPEGSTPWMGFEAAKKPGQSSLPK